MRSLSRTPECRNSLRTWPGSPAMAQGPWVDKGLAMLLILALSVTLGMLQGCATLGVPAAKTFEERLAVGYATVTSVREAALTFLRDKADDAQNEEDPAKRDALLKQASDDAQNIQDQADEARRALDISRSLKGVDFKAADARLASTLQVLSALQTYLEGRR